MGTLLIRKPERAVAWASASPDLPRLLTADPREGAYLTAGSGPRDLDLDLGAAVALDTAFLGYHNVAAAGPTWQVRTIAELGGAVTETLLAPTALQQPGGGDPRHAFAKAAAPVVARYVRLTLDPGNVAFHAGVFAVAGFGVQPVNGHEWECGRLIDDTGAAERLFGGGFGIDEGVAAGGFQWTFGDLQPDEVRTLYKLARERRTTRSVLVVEDPDADDVGEGVHWGLFDRFEPYARRDPANTRWSLRIRDWA